MGKCPYCKEPCPYSHCAYKSEEDKAYIRRKEEEEKAQELLQEKK